MKERDIVFDIMKGIGILAVMIGHYNDIPYMPIRHFCFSFHMPLFFIIAGYFHYRNDNAKVIKKSFKRLIIPYLATAAIMILYSCYLTFVRHDYFEVPKEICATIFVSGATHSSLLLGDFRPIGAIWFLVALFWCKVVFNYLQGNIKNSSLFYFITVNISIIATLIDRYLINLPFAILPGLSALIFYLLGYIAKNHQLPKYLYLIIALFYPLSFWLCKIYMVQCYYTWYPLAVLGSSGGVYLIYLLSTQLKNLHYFAYILSMLGQTSLLILCVHMIEALCHLYEFTYLPKDLEIQVPIRLLSTITISYLLSKLTIIRQIFKV